MPALKRPARLWSAPLARCADRLARRFVTFFELPRVNAIAMQTSAAAVVRPSASASGWRHASSSAATSSASGDGYFRTASRPDSSRCSSRRGDRRVARPAACAVPTFPAAAGSRGSLTRVDDAAVRAPRQRCHRFGGTRHPRHWPVNWPELRIDAREFLNDLWSGTRVSNPRPSAWEADALPTELVPQQRGSRSTSNSLRYLIVAGSTSKVVRRARVSGLPAGRSVRHGS